MLSDATRYPHIAKCKNFTQDKLRLLRQCLSQSLSGDDFAVVAAGSYGRHEASDDSDLDFFLISNGGPGPEKGDIQKLLKKIAMISRYDDFALHRNLEAVKRVIRKANIREPATGGAFGRPANIEHMVHSIGGSRDSNDEITRRILFMLESTDLYNSKLVNDYKRRLVEAYVGMKMRPESLPRFFLNDVIRYWRTMCVDYEFKISEQGKSWGLRNIKLVWSRKLLYFGGIVLAAEATNRDRDGKIERIVELMRQPPLERVHAVFGEKASTILEFYDGFLAAVGDPKLRDRLDKLTNGDHSDTEFRRLKDKGQRFSGGLRDLLRVQYGKDHPIHDALIM